MILNFSNVEELVFFNDEVKKILPIHYRPLFEQWKLGKHHAFLKHLGKSAVLDFLNQLKDEDIPSLEDYFGEKITVDRLNYSAVLNLKIPIESNICDKLCEIMTYPYFSISRDETFLYVSFWR